MNLPLPKECHQQWLDMKPVEGGRMCDACQKKIFDMSRMSWPEIEELQRKNNYSVCGMYSDKQIQQWGKDVPKKKKSFSANMILASLLFYFSNTTAESSCEIKTETYIQIPPEKSENKTATIVSDTIRRTFISGKITALNTDSTEIIGDSITIQLNRKIITTSVLSGKYFSIDITSDLDSISAPVLGFFGQGYYFTTHVIKPEQIGTTIELNLVLEPIRSTYYIVRKPNVIQRLLHRRWYRKVNKRGLF